MRKHEKPIERVQIADLETNPVWKYTENEKSGDTVVCPVKQVPVKSLTGKVVATQVSLANGSLVWALIGNVDGSEIPVLRSIS